MSQDLIKARKLLAGLNTHLKQDKVLPATQALYQAVVAVCKNPLLKAERAEFEKLIQLALEHLSAHKLFCQYYPLQIAYTPGKERDLAMTLKEVFAEVQRGMNDEVKVQAGDMAAKRDAALKKAQEYIEAQEIDKARDIFDKLLAAFKGDTALVGDIADRLIQAGQFRDAFGYLQEALARDPNAMHLYNRIGIALRKLQDFGTAEQYYLKALEIAPRDEFLWFNIGRLYIDWCKWDKVEESANRSLNLNPGFEQAAKMLTFARKKQGR